MNKQLVVTWVVFLLALAALAFWCDHVATARAKTEVARQKDEDFQYWKNKLLPLYKEFRINYVEEPTTRDELFAPVFKMLRPLSTER